MAPWLIFLFLMLLARIFAKSVTVMNDNCVDNSFKK
jgi:hypothetical protein